MFDSFAKELVTAIVDELEKRFDLTPKTVATVESDLEADAKLAESALGDPSDPAESTESSSRATGGPLSVVPLSSVSEAATAAAKVAHPSSGVMLGGE